MVYDAYGRPVISVQVNTAYFLEAPKADVKNGRFRIKNDSDGKWYTILCSNDPTTGYAVLSLSDVGELV